jgi:hypothetical protein
VLQLEVLLQQQHQRCQLQLQPAAGDFVEGLAVWLRGIEGMARAVPRLLQHLHLQVCECLFDMAATLLELLLQAGE